ncbi:hypothetical protein AOCH_000085 [Aspergillus ochraceoroseus]|uniref:Uncharacterized protein n=1 Tax=Aspergillus ochraceoroseus TaxID=138278 RepID=A0A0F8V1F0_9EURO|nr:hypothetical protein AOCH_000085 [Aspergillus ochraceoroseus]
MALLLLLRPKWEQPKYAAILRAKDPLQRVLVDSTQCRPNRPRMQPHGVGGRETRHHNQTRIQGVHPMGDGWQCMDLLWGERGDRCDCRLDRGGLGGGGGIAEDVVNTIQHTRHGDSTCDPFADIYGL